MMKLVFPFLIVLVVDQDYEGHRVDHLRPDGIGFKVLYEAVPDLFHQSLVVLALLLPFPGVLVFKPHQFLQYFLQRHFSLC